MAYAYLFKYIIIGDTGKRRGRGGEARRPRESGGRAGGAERRAGPGSPLPFPQCWRRRRGGPARRGGSPPPSASALGPARGLGLPLGGSAPGGLGPRRQARKPDSRLRARLTGRGAGRAVSRPWLRHPSGGAAGEKALSLQNLHLGSALYLHPRGSEAGGVARPAVLR